MLKYYEKSCFLASCVIFLRLGTLNFILVNCSLEKRANFSTYSLSGFHVKYIYEFKAFYECLRYCNRFQLVKTLLTIQIVPQLSVMTNVRTHKSYNWILSFEFLTANDIDRDAMDVFGDKRGIAQDVFVEKLPSFWNRFVHVNKVFRLKRYCNTKQH